MVARIAEAISLGLTDEETSALVDIEPNTLPSWKKDAEYDPNAVVSTGKRSGGVGRSSIPSMPGYYAG
jgi:hypothetical protein